MLRSFLVLFICCVGFSVPYSVPLDLEFESFPFKQECGPNEVPAGCINPCPPQTTCQDREHHILCLDVVVRCEYQCHCKEGYIRKNGGGECIPIEECGIYCTRDEEYTDCKQSCLNETCSARKNPSKCVSEESEPCKPGCTCKDGYFRDDEDSTCIPKYACPDIEDTIV